MKQQNLAWLVVAGVALSAAAQWAAGCGGGEAVTPSGGAGSTGNPGGAGATGTGGTNPTGAAGSNPTGAAGSNPTGAAGSNPTGAAGSNPMGVAGTTGTTDTKPATFAYLFPTTIEGWALNDYADTGRINLADPARAASPAPTLVHDATMGDPEMGSLKVTATFNEWKQFVDAVINVSPRKNLPARVLRARVRLVSGNFTGGAQLHAGSGDSYTFAAGAWTTMTPGSSWIELWLDLDAAKASNPMFDPTQVVQIGVKFDTGGESTSPAFGAAVSAVFQIDSVSDGVLGGDLAPQVNYTFDADAQAFVLNNHENTTRKNLAAPSSTAAHALVWDGADGNPMGSLKASATYSDWKQYIDPSVNLSSVDLTGKVISAWVRMDSGGFIGGAQLHAGSGPNYVYAASTWLDLVEGAWTEVSLDLAAAQTSVTGFMANDIRQIGVQLDTGDGLEGGAFGGTVEAVFHIDNITAR
jgi:hypothetical protein